MSSTFWTSRQIAEAISSANAILFNMCSPLPVGRGSCDPNPGFTSRHLLAGRCFLRCLALCCVEFGVMSRCPCALGLGPASARAMLRLSRSRECSLGSRVMSRAEHAFLACWELSATAQARLPIRSPVAVDRVIQPPVAQLLDHRVGLVDSVERLLLLGCVLGLPLALALLERRVLACPCFFAPCCLCGESFLVLCRHWVWPPLASGPALPLAGRAAGGRAMSPPTQRAGAHGSAGGRVPRQYLRAGPRRSPNS